MRIEASLMKAGYPSTGKTGQPALPPNRHERGHAKIDAKDPKRTPDLRSKLTNEREIAANILVRPDDDDRQHAMED
jgi:hypothetical protein